MDNKKIIHSYKGFNKDLKCRGFQYEVGKDFEMDSAIEVCERGFHACEFPLDVFSYYAPADSRYCKVEQSGKTNKSGDGSKVASSKIHISCEIGLKGIIEAGVKFILDKVNWKDNKESNTGDWSAATNTGDWSAATNTGYQSAAANTGNHSAATNTGNCSAATNTGNHSAAKVSGKESIAIVTGRDSKAAGALGDWIVLTERGEWNGDTCPIKDVKAFRVDGEKIKPDTWYQLVDGEAVEVE